MGKKAATPGRSIGSRFDAAIASALLIGTAAIAGAMLLGSSARAVPGPDKKRYVPKPRPVSPDVDAPLPPPVEPPSPEWGLPASQRSGLSSAAVVFGILVAIAVSATGAWMALGLDSSTMTGKHKWFGSSEAPASCPSELAVQQAGAKDGRFPLQLDLPGLIAADIASFLVLGQEAAAGGRPRDAEVAFLMSCAVADKIKGVDSLESADAKYQLAAHYAKLATLDGGTAASNAAELLGRAEALYSGSLQTYVARHGPNHEKARFASEGLASVRQVLAGNGFAQPDKQVALQNPPDSSPAAEALGAIAMRPPTPLEPAGPAGSVEGPRATEAPHQRPATTALATAVRPGPSFDCRKARSAPEKMICSNAELAQLDRELGRLYARAKNATSDRAGFRRRQEQEWRWRETFCRDQDCLLRWYAHRREQLINDIEGHSRARPTAAREGA